MKAVRRAAAVAALLGLLGPAGCGGKSEAERVCAAVLRVLKEDRQLVERTQNLPPDAKPSQVAWAIGRYCDGLEALPMSDCPADFRVAYKQHTRAWRAVQDATAALPNGLWSGLWMGVKNQLLRGEADGGQSRLEGGLQKAFDEVKQTWQAIEQTAAKYGAAL